MPGERLDFEIRVGAAAEPWASPGYQCLHAMRGEEIAGSLVWRDLAPNEIEILDLNTAPEFRGRGVARTLLRALLKDHPGAVFLEVRESNAIARRLYASVGFAEIGFRKHYYAEPLDNAIVMKFYS